MNSAQSSIEQAEQLYSQRKYHETAVLLEQAVAAQPEEGRLWLLRGRVSFRLGDFSAAVAAFEQAGTLVPLDARDQCLLGQSYLNAGQDSPARAVFRLLVEAVDCPTEVLSSIAAALGRSGDADAALEVCRVGALRQPERPEPLMGMTYYLRRLGYPPGVAVPLMTKAVSLAPDETLYAVLLAFLLADDGKPEEAYDLLRDITLTKVNCSCQLRRMMTIFQGAADHQRWSACHDELSRRGTKS